MVVLFIFLSVIILLLLWIFFAPLELIIDTRVPLALMRLRSIGKVSIDLQQDDLWVSLKVFFMRFHWRLQDLAKKKSVTKSTSVKKQKVATGKPFAKMLRVLKSIEVKNFELQLSPPDYALTGQLYPLNFIALPAPYKLSVTFSEEAYLMVRTTTAAWRIALALIRK